MPKLKDVNFFGGRVCVCDRCDTVYTKYTALKEGTSCPKCGGRLILKELTRGDTRYSEKEADERSM